MVPPLDIFRVDTDGVPTWCATAESLDAAKARVEKLRVFQPGEYLIVSFTTGHRISVPAKIDDKSQN